MNKLFRKTYILRRYGKQEIVEGHSGRTPTDISIKMDVQTTDDSMTTTEDGTKAVQSLKTFSEDQILTEDVEAQTKADRLFFAGKWYECRSSRLSQNTPLKHWTSTWIEALDQEEAPDES